MESWSQLAPQIVALARRAGAVILAEQAAGIETRLKPDGSPQTNADRSAEACILDGLHHLTPAIPVIAEESQAPLYDRTQPFWLVDPLDGTKSFVQGLDDFSVNIALVIHTRPVFGVIYAPALEEMFWNDKQQVWRQAGDAAAQSITTRPRPSDGLTMITGRRTQSHGGGRLNQWKKDQPIAEHIMLSSALKHAYVAMGRADIYPRFGETMEWDNAAGEAILHAAGGLIHTLDGQPLPYGQPHLTHHGFIAYGHRD